MQNEYDDMNIKEIFFFNVWEVGAIRFDEKKFPKLHRVLLHTGIVNQLIFHVLVKKWNIQVQ